MPRTNSLPTLAVTAGEPAGIGPDLCVLLAQLKLPARIVVIADKNLLAERAVMLKKKIHLVDFTPGRVKNRASGGLLVLHEPVAKPVVPGKLDPANSGYVLRTLQQAVRGCLETHFDAMVTAPVHKGVINDAGIPFTGHTEYLARQTATRHVVMLLTGGGLRVALATTHLALKDVPGALTQDSLERCLRILHHDLIARFGIAAPRILVAGLNPHAGESGYLGNEETQTIGPVVNKLLHEGFDVQGPLPADTLFTHERLKSCDCALAMYHDQGLPVLKYASFGSGVNVTLGLPIIRTSVDHGTALELAGTGKIDSGSLLAAIKLAMHLSYNAKHQKQRSASKALSAGIKKRTGTHQQHSSHYSTMHHTARKRFSQNFLVDRKIIGAITAAIAPQNSDRMVEIGPGMGALTRPLLEQLEHLHAVEIDRDIAARLIGEFPASRLTVHVTDALRFDFSVLGENLRVVGNLPYNISSPLLFHLTRFASRIRDLHVMLQKEVVERIVAAPSTAAYGRLSVMLQYRYTMDKLMDVPSDAFRPAPRVESAVIRMLPRVSSELQAKDESLFARIVRSAFSQRRKTLRNTLGNYLTREDFEELSIDPGWRAQNLTSGDFARIANHLGNKVGR